MRKTHPACRKSDGLLGPFTHASWGEHILEPGAASRLYFMIQRSGRSLWPLIHEGSTVANHRRILRGRISSAPYESRKRNHTYDNSEACRDKSEAARTSPAAADTGFSLRESDPNRALRVFPLLRKRRRETSRSDPRVASRHASATAPKYATTHATCAVGNEGNGSLCQTRVCQPGRE